MSWRRFEGRNLYGFPGPYHNHPRPLGRVRGRGGKGRGRGPGRQSQAKSDGQVDVVIKRVLSANELRMKELQNQLHDMKKQLKAVKDENRLFKQVQHKQERALKKFEDTESQLPQLIQAHNNEVRSLREQLRRAREKYEKTDRYLRDAEDELEKATSLMKKYKDLSEQKNLRERNDLDQRLSKAEVLLDEKSSRVVEQERHLEMVKKNHRHEMGIERARAKEAQKQIDEMKEEKARLEALVKEKEKQLDTQNIYSNRLLNGGTPAHTPPLWRQNLNKQSGSMTDLSFRERAKAYEDKRRADVAGKKEKPAQSHEPKPKVVEEKKEEEPRENKKMERQDSEAEFWRRQEERYKLDQLNREKQEDDRKRKEEEETRFREEQEKMKRDLENRARADRERREAEERERRERERKEELERKERDAREREEKEKEEKERKEAEQREIEKREEELRAREEQERLATEARLAEERRKKEDLLRRLQQMDGSGNPSQPSSDPFAPSDSTRARGGDPFAPSPSKKKDYTFTQTVENLHKGKPSHDVGNGPQVDRHNRLRAGGDDSDIGGYQPSFTGPIKTVGMKQKKPFSLFNDSEAKPAAGSADKKSRLMADLFGSQKDSDSKKSDSDDLFLGTRPAPRQPVQNKRAGVFPWDDPPPPTSKPKEVGRRDSSALFGGGAAVVDDNDESLGHSSAGPKSTLLPRRPRQTATTFNSKPAVLAVDNFDDDIEEVVL